MRFRIEEYHYKVCTVVDPIFKTLHAATLQKNMCMVIVFEAFFRTIPCYGENSYLHMSVITILGPSASEVPCKICDLTVRKIYFRKVWTTRTEEKSARA